MTRAALETRESILDVVARFVELGEESPTSVASRVERHLGEDILRDQLFAIREEILADLARRELGRVRRRREIALRPGDEVTTSHLLIAKAWVPGVGWKKAAYLTCSDLLARAEWYESFADASLRRAQWCREVAAIMETQGAHTLGDVRGALPVIPIAEIEAPS